MGVYLSTASTSKQSAEGSLSGLRYGVSAMQGWRKHMEDAHVAARIPGAGGACMFGVFDGHGGEEVARFCERRFVEQLPLAPGWEERDWGRVLHATFLRMDELLADGVHADEVASYKRRPPVHAPGSADGANGPQDAAEVLRSMLELRRNSLAEAARTRGAPVTDQPAAPLVQAGCTAVVAVLDGSRLVVANAGDSRAVLCRQGGAVDLSHDHRPTQPGELERITRAGGFVTAAGRVNGNLNLSRAIGDLRYKQASGLPAAEQAITAAPDVEVHEVQPGDEFLVVACDGVWDCKSSEEVVSFVRERLAMRPRPAVSQVVEELLDDCLAKDPRETAGVGGDNMTCIVVLLENASNSSYEGSPSSPPTPTALPAMEAGAAPVVVSAASAADAVACAQTELSAGSAQVATN